LVGLSHLACWRRLQRLREEDYIVKETAVLDRKKLRFGTQVYALVKLSNVGRANLAGFADAIPAVISNATFDAKRFFARQRGRSTKAAFTRPRWRNSLPAQW
jgi:DNA-binding Lrp family transcriptional regulator